jgi:hypothetical protein
MASTPLKPTFDDQFFSTGEVIIFAVDEDEVDDLLELVVGHVEGDQGPML